jgi:hypothetical protein
MTLSMLVLGSLGCMMLLAVFVVAMLDLVCDYKGF